MSTKQYKCASFEAPQTHQTTARDFMAHELIEAERLVSRALTFHPGIIAKVYLTKVQWDAGLRRSAGQFNTLDGIKLHPGLKAAKREDFLATFLHELAHAMQFYQYGEINHSATWWEMMHQLGQKPEKYHNIDSCMKKVQPATLGINAEDLGL